MRQAAMLGLSIHAEQKIKGITVKKTKAGFDTGMRVSK
jgi:hypothetical protein